MNTTHDKMMDCLRRMTAAADALDFAMMAQCKKELEELRLLDKANR